MLNTDEEALICDLAEVYHLYDYKELPPLKVALFAVGLRDNSRIKLKLNGRLVDDTELLLAGILDHVKLLVYAQSEDAYKGINRPDSIVDKLLGRGNKDYEVYSAEDFISERERILKKIENGN